MKRLFLLCTLLAVLSSCGKDENEGGDGGGNNPNPPAKVVNLELTNTDIVFGAPGGDEYFNISCNSSWTIAKNAEWLQIDTPNGTGNARIKLTATESSSYDDRNTVLTITAGDKTKTFTVIQKKRNALIVTHDKFNIPQEGGNFSIELQSNIAYEITIPDDYKDWIKENPNTETKALENYTHNFTVTANPNTEKREGFILITGPEDITETVAVYQTQKDELILTQNTYTLPAKGETIIVELQTNVAYEVIIPTEAQSWIKQLKVEQEDRIVLDVAPNSETSERTVEILVKDKNSVLSQTLKIRQVLGQIILDKDEYNVAAKGETMVINLSADIDFEVIISEDSKTWISKVKTKSLQPHSFSLVISPNSTTEKRMGEVIVKDVNSALQQSLTIKQAVGNIKLEKTSYEVSPLGETIDVSLKSDVEISVIIPESAKSWIGNKNIEATENDNKIITFEIAPNESDEERSAEIIVKDVNSELQRLFTVKQTTKFIYNGNIILRADEDITKLRDAGYKTINGNLTIMVPNPQKLENKIENITGDLIISGPATQSFDGLYRLKHIGGSLRITNGCFTDFEGLGNLQTIGQDFLLEAASGKELDKLQNFKGLENLKLIGGDLELSISNVHNSSLPFHDLQDFTGLNNLEKIQGSLKIDAFTSDGIFSSFQGFQGLNKLQSIEGDFYITNMRSLTSFIGLESLTTIGGRLNLYNTHSLKSFNGLNNLHKIGADLFIRVHVDASTSYSEKIGGPNFTSFTGLNSLQEIGGNFTLVGSTYIWSRGQKVSVFQELKNFSGLENLSKIGGDFKLLAHNTYKGSMSDSEFHCFSNLESLDGFNGIKEVGGSLLVENTSMYYKDVFPKLQGPLHLDNIEVVGGNIEPGVRVIAPNIISIGGTATALDMSNIPKLTTFNSDISISDQTTINAESLISINGMLRLHKIDNLQCFPNLQTVMSLSLENCSNIELGSLTTINEDFSISECSNINISSLSTIGGDLLITKCNWDNLVGFSKISQVTSITISDCPSLYNFCPLKSLVENMSGIWSVYNCGYNPSKYHMLNGACSPE